MVAALDAYYALRPVEYTEFVAASIEPSPEPSTQGLSLRLVLGHGSHEGRHLVLLFEGVTGLSVDDFSGPRISYLEIVSTRERGWEAPLFLVSSDQGRLKFGCMTFAASLASE